MEKSKWSKQMEWKTVIILLLITIAVFPKTKAQSSMIECCVDNSLAIDTTYAYPRQVVEYANFHDEKVNCEVKKWMESINKDNLKIYMLSNRENREEYLLLSSTILAATGLATNFYNWLVIDLENKLIVDDRILSLSCNPNNFHMEKNVLHIIKYEFSDNFIHDRNLDDFEITKIEYILRDNKLVKKNIFNIKCN